MKKLATLLLVFFSLFCTFALISCGKGEKTHYHSYIGHIRYDADGHWEECDCGEIFNYSRHSGEQMGADEDSHYSICNVCEQAFNVTPHSGATEDCDETHHFNVCDGCGEGYNESSHHYSDSMNYDGSLHWYECTDCDYVPYFREHSYSKQKTDEHHWEECVDCGITTEKKEHTYEVKPLTYGTHWSVCSFCSHAIDEVEHSCDIFEQYDKNQHNEKCICGEKYTVSHTFEDGQCKCGYKIYTAGLEYSYMEGDKEYWVAGIGTATDMEIIIPEKHEGLPVTRISSSAFYGCKIYKITIPKSIEWIGDDAFFGCNTLVEVINKSSLSIKVGDVEHGRIAEYAIEVFTEETSNHFAKEGDFVFYNSFYKHLIAYTGSETDIVVPDDVDKIHRQVFAGNGQINSITIPKSVTEIGYSAFYNCNSLTGVYISDIAAWCKMQFKNNTSNPLFYAHNLYLNNQLVTDLVLPSGINSISRYAFYDCDSLTNITIPDGVNYFGANAFWGCSNLRAVYISDIAWWLDNTFERAYIDSYSYTFGYYSNPLSVAGSLYVNNYLITELYLPYDVTSIPAGAFYRSNITEIVIPNSVSYIGVYAFRGCSSLTDVRFEKTNWWTVNSTTLSSSALEDSKTAAEYLKSTYYLYSWTRSDE